MKRSFPHVFTAYGMGICLNGIYMKSVKVVALLMMLPLLIGCSGSEKEVPATVESVFATVDTGDLVKNYLKDNVFIDVDLQSVASELSHSGSRAQSVSREDMAKAKTAVYRFYKNVSLKDGYYSCSAKNGAEINISEKAFGVLSDNLVEINSFIKDALAKGEPVHLPPLDEEYFESLLK